MVQVSGAEEPVVRPYDWRVDSSGFAVIDAIARYEGIETPRIAEHLPALHETVDTDALNRLLRHSDSLNVSFLYAGYRVRIMDDAVGICQAGVLDELPPGGAPPGVSGSHFFA